jgi:hypothetical protein
MSSSITAKAASAAVEGLKVVSPLPGWLMSKVLDAYLDDTSNQIAGSSTLDETRKIAEKQRMAIELMERRASAAQEFALAHRMATADEVEVEEHYDVSGEGMLGLDAQGDAKTQTVGASLGLKGSGRVMRKRIIRLKGLVDGQSPMESVQQNPARDVE